MTKSIEDIRVGERVLVDLPNAIRTKALDELAELADWDQAELDPAEWQCIEFESFKPNGTRCEIKLLRPAEWVEINRITAGAIVHLVLPEQGIDGPVKVVAVEACPPVTQGGGSVVTGTFTHIRSGVLRLYLSGRSEPLGVTDGHHIYSVDRDEFVPAAELTPGERLQLLNRRVTVAQVEPMLGEHRVYNLEVQGEHAYRVTELGLIVHNTSMTGNQRALKELVDEATLGGRRPLTTDQAETVLDWAQEVGYPGWRAGPGDVASPSNWTANPVPHIHLPGAGRGGHVPVQPGVVPRL